MARLRFSFAIAVSLLLFAAPALAADPPSAPAPAFYDRPVLVIHPGMHTNTIWQAALDAESRWVASGSNDKTVRVWSHCSPPQTDTRSRAVNARIAGISHRSDRCSVSVASKVKAGPS